MGSAKRERQRANRERGRIEQVAAQKAAKRKKSTRNTAITVAVVAVVFIALAYLLSRGDDDGDSVATDTTVAASDITVAASDGCGTDVPTPPASRPDFTALPADGLDPASTYQATFETSCGTIVVALDPTEAPQTVNNFVTLARAGYYDATVFHRVVTDFVVQGGDPTGTGSGGPSYQVPDEFPATPYQLGDLVTAASAAGQSSSQFFFVTGANGTSLPQQYNRFGHIVTGLDVAQKLESFADPAAANGDPSQQVPSRTLYLLKVTIEETPVASTTATTAGA